MEGTTVVVIFWLIINKEVEVFKTKRDRGFILHRRGNICKGKNSTFQNYYYKGC